MILLKDQLSWPSLGKWVLKVTCPARKSTWPGLLDGTCFEPCNRNLLLFISPPTYCTFKHVRYIQQLEIWATALLEEISNIDKFFIFLWMFVYSKETISITVEPRYNEPLYNKVLGITNDFLYPSHRKIWEKTSLIWQTHFASRLALR